MVYAGGGIIGKEREGMKSQLALESFTKYCEANPELRFWQALRNWSGWHGIYASDRMPTDLSDLGEITNTFNWEGVNNLKGIYQREHPACPDRGKGDDGVNKMESEGGKDVKPYDYVNRAYGLNVRPGMRVITSRGEEGTVLSRLSYDHRVHVKLDGVVIVCHFHPLDLHYLEDEHDTN